MALDEPQFEQMKAYVGFDDGDAKRLRALSGPLKPHLNRVIDVFYECIERDPVARTIIGDNQAQTQRLRRTLLQWLEDFFSGTYDWDYLEKHSQIGRKHVAAGMPQFLMFTAMNVVRQELCQLLVSVDLTERAAHEASVHKLIDLELAAMLETYRDDYVTQIKRIERRELERKLEAVEHMANIGKLAASLAHEIKNPLAGISGAIQVISRTMDESNPHLEILREILGQIDRLDSVVKDLLVFARPIPPELTRVNLGHLVGRTLMLLQQEPNLMDMKIRCHGLDQPSYIHLDERQIEQLLNNLLLNAAQACDGKGTIDIRLRKDTDCYSLKLADSGKGMSPEIATRAFEPFFTTKAKGSGLGLPICRRIVNAHNGSIVLNSIPQQGTTVTIELPAGIPHEADKEPNA